MSAEERLSLVKEGEFRQIGTLEQGNSGAKAAFGHFVITAIRRPQGLRGIGQTHHEIDITLVRARTMLPRPDPDQGIDVAVQPNSQLRARKQHTRRTGWGAFLTAAASGEAKSGLQGICRQTTMTVLSHDTRLSVVVAAKI
ncbi:hypothetical protein [Amycolatopsis sp. NPDC049868]|uniref:hypothetical protein n=1 Tax=Amycolatopsis sp. NPDC049868 TaxID=3363934 RepID=UPI003792D6CE